MATYKPLNQNKMGDMEFNGTPEEWDALVKKNKEQETLEEVAKRLHPEEWDWREREIFIAGAKWQAERMYSEEDMKNAFDSAREFNSLDGIVDVHIVLPMGGDMSDLQPLHFTFEEWFAQFKKK